MRICSLFVIVFVVIAACVEPVSEQKLTLPSGLQVELTLDEEGSGVMNVKATASLTNFHTIDFGDGSPTERSVDGVFEHRYAATGTYLVKVNAHVTTFDFISNEKTADVSVNLLKIPTGGPTSPLSYPGKTLIWQEEFSGSGINATDWTYDIGTGNGGWGNNELQYYRTDNVSLIDGHLVITAKKEPFLGREYTSTRLKTQGLRSFNYGRIDVRAAMPEGQGIWPAIWMLGTNITSVGWPRCGEIDIAEMVGGQGREKTVLGTVHWDNNGTYASFGGTRTLTNGTLAKTFHIYSIEWTSQSIKWYIDDVQYHEIDINPAELSEFKNSYFLILNLAVGGNLPGNPNSSTVFPQYFIVDYIRYFK